MARCPITYQKLTSGQYSNAGLRLLAPGLNAVKEIDLDFQNGTSYAQKPFGRACHAKLLEKEATFISGNPSDPYVFIDDYVSNRNHIYNLDLTLKLAAISRIRTVPHGLIYAKSQSLLFWYKPPRFFSANGQLQISDFASMESEKTHSLSSLIETINTHCTFPALEKLHLLRLALFSFLSGHDAITEQDTRLCNNNGTIETSPHYQLYNHSLYEETKTQPQFLDISTAFKSEDDAWDFTKTYLNIHYKAFKQVLNELEPDFLKWLKLIELSYLENVSKKTYIDLLRKRRKCLFKL